MYLEKIKLVAIEPCLAESGKIQARAVLSRDITDLMPYLNAVVPRAGYDSAIQSLSFRHKQRLVKLSSSEVLLAKVENTTAALETLDWLKDLINTTCEQMNNLVPVHENKQIPSVTDVWKLLPRTNCGQCGELTCLAFAVALWTGNATVCDCQPLCERHEQGPVKAIVDYWSKLG